MHYHIVTKLYASKHNYVNGLLIRAPYKHLHKAARLLCPGAYLMLCCSENELYQYVEVLIATGLVIKDIILVIGSPTTYWILAQKHISAGKLLMTLLQHNIGALHITLQPYSNVVILHDQDCCYDDTHQVWRCHDNCAYKAIKFIEPLDEDAKLETAYTEYSDIDTLLCHFIRLIAPENTKLGLLGFPATLAQKVLAGMPKPENSLPDNVFAEVLIEDI